MTPERQQLVTDNLHVADIWAASFFENNHRRIRLEDWKAEARYALALAAHEWKGVVPFRLYAITRVKQELIRWYRKWHANAGESGFVRPKCYSSEFTGPACPSVSPDTDTVDTADQVEHILAFARPKEAALCRAVLAGESKESIGRRLGVTGVAVHKYLRRMGQRYIERGHAA